MSRSGNLHCIEQFRVAAEQLLDKRTAGFLSSPANEGITYEENTKAFKRYKFRPKLLRDVSIRDLSTNVLGENISIPIGVSPLSVNTMFHSKGELAVAKDLDARQALKNGADAIMVSNHGGRQLDGVPATVDVLVEVVNEVAGACEVYLDGGVRSGTDVLKALAMGARVVFIGRPAVWGLTCDGEDGVMRVLSLLKEELDISMALCGQTFVQNTEKDIVFHQSFI